MEPNKYVRYSEAFKQQVVSEVQSGRHRCAFAATQAYGIKGVGTVTRWLRQYGRSDLVAKQITITTMEEKDEKKALKERLRQLERALADAHMKGLLGESYLEIACERLGTDINEFKKKHVTELSTGPKSKGAK
jgi:transposase-like protein